jgi:two-component system, LytTR family, response regulator AlgR
MTHRVLIVDDEPPARERMRRLLGELGNSEVVGECGAGDEAVRLAGELRPDVVLLDVRMPGMDGLEAARHMAALPIPPAVIFTTAYDTYAVEAFDAEAVGYLLKPVRGERLAAALERASRVALAKLERVATTDGRPAARTHVAARLRDTVKLIPVRDIYYFSADQKYTSVRHAGGTDLIEESLRALEVEFGERFVRVHRNALANVQQLAAIERDTEGQYDVVLRDIGEKLRVSRRLAGELRERLRL